ncbi:MAG: Ribulose-phosphate 3-epimerase [Elusimicrobia bacterium ADurb.Bin231]|nr:MAG: Ribulose-phosphate 3-epimerase [Elusimicrobia bacterium ADurb.Bin231]
MEIAPSILSADFANLAKDIKQCELAKVKILHIDVMDGNFVPNITIGPVVISAIRRQSKLIFDTHLMINSPDKYVEAFVKAGSDWITFHIEAVKNPFSLIKKIRSLGAKPGISINPFTSLRKISRYLDMVDLVLVMSVNPGFGGQKFISDVLPKIETLKKEKRNFKISVDGGINFDTISAVAAAGADIAVAGNAVFGNCGNIVKNIKKLYEFSKI